MIIQSTTYKILIIDDELGPRESLKILLKNTYQVHCAESGEQGLTMIKEVDPDLIVLDIRMPGIGGIETLRRIRQVDPNVSLIMLTGFGALETAQEALRLGANDYIKKPFDAKEMLEVVDRNVKRSQVARRRAKALTEFKELNSRLMNELAKKDHMATLGQASAEFVHDLRTPLTVVLGYIQILFKKLEATEGVTGGPLQETLDFLDVIEKNVKRCCELSEVWQSLGRKDPNRLKPTLLNEVLEEIAHLAGDAARKSGVELKLNVAAEKLVIHADFIQVFRAIQNVVMNAIQAITSGAGTVRITCKRDETWIDLQIADDGCGIAPEQLQRIFEPYFTTKEAGKGTGLGLLITKKVIEDHGGTIDVQSELQRGTTFFIRLPAMLPDSTGKYSPKPAGVIQETTLDSL